MRIQRLLFMAILFTLSGTTATAEEPISYSIDQNNKLTARFELDGTPGQVWKLITNYEQSHLIMPNVKKTIILSRENNVVTVETTVGTGLFSMTYTAIMTEIPRERRLIWQQKKGSFSKNNGSWKLTYLDDNRTAVIYQIEMDHVMLPNGLRRKLVKGSVPDLYESLQKHLKIMNYNGKVE
ncbi:MAG: SRPBCC family protein [Spirochaetes bacterium]|jgi:ribosome-associated toxin RatA of RatAB toxin-antitoxin module|nr:SRPBCC family protein [Spirochaetota bacterium]